MSHFQIDPKNGAVASLARMDRAHGICNYILASIVSMAVMTMSVPAWAVNVTVPNFSFEQFTGPLNTGNQPNFNDWTETGGWVGRTNPSIDRTATDGTVMLTLRRNNIPNGAQDNLSVFQTLSETIDTTQTYTLTVDVGRAFNGLPSAAGGELYWNNAGTPTRIRAASYQPASDTAFTTLNLQVSGAELAGLAGQQLGIRLFTTATVAGQEVAYDNVRLTKVAAPTPAGAPTTITVPDFSFETSGVHNGSWTANPQVWGGIGWPITGTGYGQTPTNGTDIANHTAYQLLTDTFIEGATYTLTVDHSLRGDSGEPGQEFDTGSIMFFRQNQNPGGPTTAFSGPTIGILDGSLANGNNPVGLVPGDWVTQTLTYVATAADAGQPIGIMVTTTSAFQGVYDNVRLTVDLAQAEAEAVPEPSTYALGLIGLAGVGLVAWRKRRVRG